MSPESWTLRSPVCPNGLHIQTAPSRMLHNLLKNKSQWRQRRRNVEERVCRTDRWVYSLTCRGGELEMCLSVSRCMLGHAASPRDPEQNHLLVKVDGWMLCCGGAAVYHLHDLRWNWRILVLTFLWKTPNIRKRNNVKTLCRSTAADQILHHTENTWLQVLRVNVTSWSQRPGYTLPGVLW